MSRTLCLLLGLFISSSLLAAPAATTTTTASTRPASTQPANDFERVAEQTAGVIDRIIDALTPVKDEESAKAALPKLDALKKEIAQLKETAAKLGQPSEPELAAIHAKYAPRIQASYFKLAAEQKRVREDLALEPILGKPLDELGIVQSAKVSE